MNPTNFPQDDEFSIIQGDGGTANLEIFYSQQFVQNEKLQLNPELLFGPLNHEPYVPGTITGYINSPNNFFAVGVDGVGTNHNGNIICSIETVVEGKTFLKFKKNNGSVVVSYEYDVK